MSITTRAGVGLLGAAVLGAGLLLPAAPAAAVAVTESTTPTIVATALAPSYVVVGKTATYKYRGGERVTIRFKNLPKNQTILLTVCRAGTNLARGGEAIGDCAPFAGPSSEFARSNSLGAGSGSVTIPRKGKLGATNFRRWTCGITTRQLCVLVVSDLSAKRYVKKTIYYRY